MVCGHKELGGVRWLSRNRAYGIPQCSTGQAAYVQVLVKGLLVAAGSGPHWSIIVSHTLLTR